MFRKGFNNLQEPYRSVIQALLNSLQEHLSHNLKSLVVFGSVARGEAKKDSDIDILIVADSLPKSRFKRQELFMEIEDKIKPYMDEVNKLGWNLDFSPILKTPEEALTLSPLYLDMVDDAIIIYDREAFFEKVLIRLRKRLEELGAERVRVGRMWYWRLKRDYRFGEVIVIE